MKFIVLIVTLASIFILPINRYLGTSSLSVDLIYTQTIDREGTSVAWHPSGDYFAVGGGQSIYFFYTDDNQPFQQFTFSVINIEGLTWNPDGTKLGVVLLEDDARPFTAAIFDLETQQITTSLEGEAITLISWNENGTLLAGIHGWTEEERVYTIWDSQTGTIIDQYRPEEYAPHHRDDIWDTPAQLQWINDTQFISISGSSELTIMELIDNKINQIRYDILDDISGGVGAGLQSATLQLSDRQPNTDFIIFFATTGDNSTIYVWDTKENLIVTQLYAESPPLIRLQWNPVYHLITSTSRNGTISFWDAQTTEQITTIDEQNQSMVLGIAWNPQGDQLVTVNRNGTVNLWSVSFQN